ncbi:putative amino-acid permease protein YxeN [compost metagenome]
MAAVICFTINIAAYNATYLFTAYQGLDKRELEAAKAQGFSSSQAYLLITLPQTVRTSTPALTNQAIANIKDSSYAFLIGYTDVFARIQELASSNFQFFNAYLFAALVYLMLVALVVGIARFLETRFFRSRL